MQRVSILPGISDHDIVQIQDNTSAKILFQKPRSIPLYKKANWDGMKQALGAYNQDMLESGKYSSLNAVQLWDDLHSTLTSLTNSSLQNSLAPEIISLKSTKNSNGLLDKETELFRNIVHQVNLLIEKGFLTSSTSSESPSNFLINPTLRIFLMWPQMILPPNPIQKNSSQTFKTRFCLCCTSTQTQFGPSGRPHESHYS